MLTSFVRPATMVGINAIVGIGLNQVAFEALSEKHPELFTKEVTLPDGTIGRVDAKVKRILVTVAVAAGAAMVGIGTAIVVDALVFGDDDVENEEISEVIE